MIRVPKEKLFDLMFETSKLIDHLDNATGTEGKVPSFEAMSKEIVTAGLVSEYIEYMTCKEKNK